MNRSDFLAIARQWKGTPYHDQARLKAVGADCIGFIIGCIAEATGRVVDAPTTYGRYPDPTGALAAVAASGEAIPIDKAAAQPADMLYMRIARQPQHFGIVSDGGQIIHCVEPVGVVEVTLAPWMLSRTMFAWRLRLIED